MSECETTFWEQGEDSLDSDLMSAVVLYALVAGQEDSTEVLNHLSEKDFEGTPATVAIDMVKIEIYRNAVALDKASRPISALSVTANMGDVFKERAEAIFQKGQDEYAKLRAKGVTLASMLDNWKHLKRKMSVRSILKTANFKLNEVRKDVAEVVTEMQDKLARLGTSQETPTTNQKDLNIQTFLQLVNAPEPYYPTGFNQIDCRIRGFVQKRTYAVCARTGVGKSAMLLNMLANVARQGVPVGFISLEMSKMDMNKRLWCIVGQVESSDLEGHPLSENMLQQCRRIHHLTESWPIYWSDKRGMTLSDLKSKMSEFARKGCKVVFIDFIQRVVVESKEPYHLQVALIAKTLSDLADKLNIAVVIATQANREGAKNLNGELELHNIADSTAIEQSCDVIILMNRKNQEDRSDGYNSPMKVKIAKNRHGAAGFFEMYFCGRTYTFNDASFLEEPPQEAEHRRQCTGTSIPAPPPVPSIVLMN